MLKGMTLQQLRFLCEVARQSLNITKAAATLSGGVLERSLIVPNGHPLFGVQRVSLADIAHYPMIGYNARFRSGQIITQMFSEQNLEAIFVVSASDADVIKAYVMAGLGIAIVPTIADVVSGTPACLMITGSVCERAGYHFQTITLLKLLQTHLR